MLNEVPTTFSGLALNLFVITCLLAMGMSLTVKQIVAPLRGVRLVVLLLCHLVLAPALACRDPGHDLGGVPGADDIADPHRRADWQA